jgi:hypothetical protein
LLRVCKSGGKIGLANWTPEGFIGQLFKTLGKYLPPPAGAKSPALWGTQARITEMFGASAASIKAERRHFTFRYRSPMHFLDVFRTYYGPTLKAFAALDETNQRRLADDILKLITCCRANILRSSSPSVDGSQKIVGRRRLLRPSPPHYRFSGFR